MTTVTELLGQALAKHPDIAAEIGAAPTDYAATANLDRAINRHIFAGQLIQTGGHAGMLLSGNAAQRQIDDTLAEGRARIAQKSPDAGRLSIAFAELFRVEEDEKAAAQQAAKKRASVEQPFLAEKEQAHTDKNLAGAIDDVITTLARTTNTPKENTKP
jgi:hypothetical protein